MEKGMELHQIDSFETMAEWKKKEEREMELLEVGGKCD
jgi:hypothetical protein